MLMSLQMAISKIAFLLGTLAVCNAASTYKKFSPSSKRAVENYNYPVPSVAFNDKDPTADKVIIETISSQGRYLPPISTSSQLSDEDNQGTVNVSYEAHEQEEQTSDEKAVVPEVTPSDPDTTTKPAQKKRPGGLGSFAYYGGKGAKKTTTSTTPKVEEASAALSQSITPRPIQPIQVTTFSPKNFGFNYPSPKNVLKPSKKEQKLADSKGAESVDHGFEYDVGPGHFLSGDDSYSSGGVFNAAPTLNQQVYNPVPQGQAMGMGLSYMRQSSPFFSYHVMLD